MHSIIAKQLTKSFNGAVAVNGLNLEIGKGELSDWWDLMARAKQRRCGF